jgi:hypothetical protein
MSPITEDLNAAQREAADAWPRRRIEPVWPLYPAGKSPQELRAAADAINNYNARVHSAVDALLIRAARWAVSIIGGAVLGLYVINVFFGSAS